MFRAFRLTSIFLLLSLVVGCVSLPDPVPFSMPKVDETKLGIVLVEQSEASATYTGSIGLLDLAIISAANSSLNKHLKTLSFDDYQALPVTLKESLESKGYDVVIKKQLSLDEGKKLKLPKNGQSQNTGYYTEMGLSDNVDYLLVLRSGALGTTRPYYGPVPTANPLTNANIIVELTDLKTSKVLWYKVATSQQVIQEPWDESKAGYPNLTSGLFSSVNQAIEMLKADVENPGSSQKTLINADKKL